ncbi:MAG: histone deacetylase family protein [Gaiellales bacterium]
MSRALGGLPLVWSDACLRHDGACGTWVGVGIDADELPERVELIRAELEAAGARLVTAPPHDDSTLLAVHDPGLVEFLRTAYGGWVDAGYPVDPGQPRVLGYIFPTPGLLAGAEPFEPVSGAARTGMWAFDTLTVVGEGTWEAARAAVDCALTAADLVARDGGVAYACTRPPGHHVTRSAFGGSCYLNNAAIAAQRLRERGAERVAIVDIDAHHGNGAQAIFWERADVLTGSAHVDPRAGWFPHFLGVESERGGGAGEGTNRNLPLAPGTSDEGWLAAIDELAGWAAIADALVIALGVDAAAGDPNSPLLVTEQGYRQAGTRLGRVAKPTVVVQEGGYDLETIGGLVRAFCEGLVDP